MGWLQRVFQGELQTEALAGVTHSVHGSYKTDHLILA